MESSQLLERRGRIQSATGDNRGNWAFYCVITVCLLTLMGLAWDASTRLSVTHDEYWHVPIGHLHWVTGRFDFDHVNPPLVRMLTALPVWVQSAKPAPHEKPQSQQDYGDGFLKANGTQFRELLISARSVSVLLSLGTGIVLGLWAWEWFGRKAAVLTVGLWSLSPMTLSFASLATTETGTAFFFTVAMWCLSKHAESPAWKKASLVGLLIGFAQLAKFTSLLLYPVIVLTCFLHRVKRSDVEPISVVQMVRDVLIIVLLSGFVLNAGYGFRGTGDRLGSYRFQNEGMRFVQEFFPDSLPVPLPRDYVEGIDHQRADMALPHPVFLDGQWRTDGFPQYYLFGFAYKLPHALQLLTLMVSNSQLKILSACEGDQKSEREQQTQLPADE